MPINRAHINGLLAPADISVPVTLEDGAAGRVAWNQYFGWQYAIYSDDENGTDESVQDIGCNHSTMDILMTAYLKDLFYRQMDHIIKLDFGTPIYSEGAGTIKVA